MSLRMMLGLLALVLFGSAVVFFWLVDHRLAIPILLLAGAFDIEIALRCNQVYRDVSKILQDIMDDTSYYNG